jgi:CTP synthase (UTP-ammonia lyase)
MITQGDRYEPIDHRVGGRLFAGVPAHVAIPKALELARATGGRDFEWRWFETASLGACAGEVAECAGVWVAPGSPYANMDGVLEVIRWAREKGRPFLGTCGGFQHR